MKKIFLLILVFLGLIFSGYSLTNIGDCSTTFQANTPGETYELTGDLTTTLTCINVTANNVVIDCKDYNISGDGIGFDYGVNINNYNGLTLMNCNLDNFYNEIRLYNSNYNLINQNSIIQGTDDSVYLYNSSFNNFTNNYFNSIVYNGASIYAYSNSNNNKVENNYINHSNYYNINVWGNYNWTFRNNYFYNTTYLYPGYNTLIENNTFDYSGDQDEFIYRYAGGIIRDNTFMNNPYGAIQYDINILDSNSIIENNIFDNISFGVDIKGHNAVSTTFGDNTFINTPIYVIDNSNIGNMYVNSNTVLGQGNYYLNDSGNDGAFIINASGVTLDCSGANIYGSSGVGRGIFIPANIEDVTITNCNIYNYNDGIYTRSYIDNINILNNKIYNSLNAGILLHSHTNSLIENNTVDNSNKGILIDDWDDDYIYNVTIKNNQVTNTQLGIKTYYDGYEIYNLNVIDNYVENSTYDCIYVDDAYGYLISGNIVKNCGDSGIETGWVGSGNYNYDILNNQISNSNKGIVHYYNLVRLSKINIDNNLIKDTNYSIYQSSTGDFLPSLFDTNTYINNLYIYYSTTNNEIYINSDSKLPRGNYYLADTDNNGAFIINKSGITFDCDGSNIYGSGIGRGIFIPANIEDVTITNCNIHNYQDSLWLSGIGQVLPHNIYNNLFNSTNPEDDDIYVANNFNNSLIGNYWANPTGTGFSQTCTNRGDGICDTNYTFWLFVDYLPLALLPVAPFDISNLGYISPTPSNNAKISYNSISVNVTYGGESVSNCKLNLDNGTIIDMADNSLFCDITFNLSNSSSITSLNYNVSYQINSNTHYLENRQITYYPQSINNQKSSIFPSVGLGSLITTILILFLFV